MLIIVIVTYYLFYASFPEKTNSDEKNDKGSKFLSASLSLTGQSPVRIMSLALFYLLCLALVDLFLSPLFIFDDQTQMLILIGYLYYIFLFHQFVKGFSSVNGCFITLTHK